MPARSNTKWGSRRLLNPYRPINWNWPGNFGLVGEWSVTPNASGYGGKYLYDLVRGAKVPHDGVLTNAPSWTSFMHPGGYGSLKYVAASSQYVSIPVLPVIQPPFTIATSIYFSTLATFGQIVAYDDGTANAGWRLQQSSSSAFEITFAGIADYTFSPILSFTTGQWYDLIVSVSGNGGTATGYAWAPSFGYYKGTVAVGTMPGSPDRMLLGTYSSFAFYHNGYLDGTQFFGRSLTESEAIALHEQLIRGNPDRWNWLSRTAWFLPNLAPVISQPSGIIIAPSTSPVPTNPSSLLLVAG